MVISMRSNWASKKPKFDKYDMTTIVEDLSVSLLVLIRNKLNYVIKDIF